MKNKYEKEYFSKIIKESINYSDVCRNLNIISGKGNRDTIKKYINEYKLDISHFHIPLPKGKGVKYNLVDILVKNSKYNHTSDLKHRLYKEDLKKRCCEMCGQGEEWMGKKISLILDHINGEHTDNRIENLRIVCPNCNATLPTHGGKNISKFKIDEDKFINKKIIKEKLNIERLNNNGKTLKQINSSIKQRKVERPDNEILLIDIKELGYSGAGRKYGVSDNAIRKWIK
jgi:hypothetical protein